MNRQGREMVREACDLHTYPIQRADELGKLLGVPQERPDLDADMYGHVVYSKSGWNSLRRAVGCSGRLSRCGLPCVSKVCRRVTCLKLASFAAERSSVRLGPHIDSVWFRDSRRDSRSLSRIVFRANLRSRRSTHRPCGTPPLRPLSPRSP